MSESYCYERAFKSEPRCLVEIMESTRGLTGLAQMMNLQLDWPEKDMTCLCCCFAKQIWISVQICLQICEEPGLPSGME